MDLVQLAACTADYNDDDDFKIKGKGKQPELVPQDNNTNNNDAPQDTCVICLEHISERAIAVPCNHLNFDFLCLASWLQEQAACPLCKATITKVQYDWRSPEDYKTYIVPTEKERASSAPVPSSASAYTRPRFPRRHVRRFNPLPRQTTPDSALSFRRRIYQSKSFSLHVGANRVSDYRNFTPNTFALNPHLQTRARTFMRRELQVFSFLQHPNIEFLIEYVVAMLKKLDIKGADGGAKDLVAEFLAVDNAALFLHELESWLRSPYERLDDWDRHVQYALPPTKIQSPRLDPA